MGAADFVNNEIKELLQNGIIRPSRSPYNSPAWVVDKKGTDDNGSKKKRLVIDFRKLNERTIADRYPMPSIPMILANLGKAQFFTTLDLKSGYHQIYLAEKDREKTSFSVNGGKYEFCRLPFGLKNAGSIFQRAIDDVLREEISKICYVYVDDVIIFSKNETEHVKHIDKVLKRLLDANMRVAREKTKFFKESVEFLGFIVTRGGTKTDPEKVRAIKEFPEPKNLFSLRSFLGMASYYRIFVKNFASIARPLTAILKGENGTVSKNMSRKVAVKFNETQRNAFDHLRNILASEDVILSYPDFKLPFDLTTDASASGIGAVLSQNKRPITMISRTLKDGELNYATNERELLAIVWAIGKLQNYLYGNNGVRIFTDHQPLTYAVSDKNTNAKIKRWKAFIDENNGKVFYTPGKQNLVADALSRQPLNYSEAEAQSDAATVHSELSLSYTIETTDKPLNCFRNQIILEETGQPLRRDFIVFGNRTRHIINFNNKDSLVESVKEIINANVVNAIHCDFPTLARIQHALRQEFPATKFWHCKTFVNDITNANEQLEITNTEHNRAHRAAQENAKQILRDYYFPNMSKLASEVVANCKPLVSRAIIDVRAPILQLVNFYPNTKTIYCDNEASFNSETITSLLRNQYSIDVVNAPPLHSSSNGQVERFHSTLAEIARCLKIDKKIEDTVELILRSTIEYNRSLHSVTEFKPVEVIHASSDEMKLAIKAKIDKAQQSNLDRINPSRQNRVFEVEDNIVAECDDGILAVSDCASTNLATFCKKASHDTCARQLHAGGAATCRTRPSNLETLTIVDDGVIIVNEKLTRITIDDSPTTTIVGTHLITFERKAVINDSVYLNLNYSVNKSPGIAASPLINITGHDHILSLPMLQRMNEHNLRLMQELREDVSAGGSPRIWFAAGVSVSLTLCALVLLQQHCRRKREAAQLQKSIDELAVTEDGVQFKGGVVNNQLPA
ncbi:hypothetical protein KR074_002460 [Drosophila pseudoananassae]|nr:hypothetical protein KR074_002460 [Drosophila pseudoananassae]